MKSAVFALLLLATVSPAMAQETRIAAVVNDEAISVSDLQARMRLVIVSSNLDDSSAAQQRISRQVLRVLIDEKLEMQEAKRLNVTVPDADVAEAMASIEKQNNMAKGALDQFLAARGVPRQTLVDQVTSTLAWNKVLRQSALQATPVSDDEIDGALAQYKQNLGLPRTRLAEVFLAVDSPQQEDEVHHFADRLYDQLRAGAKFSAVAQQFSQSATAAVGGDIGWVVPSQLLSEIAQAVAPLKPGEFSPPVRAPGGYYLAFVIERQAANSAASEDVRVSLSQIVFPLAAGASDADRQRLIARAQDLTKDAHSCGEFTKIGHDAAPQSSGDLGKVRIGDLPPELRSTVAALNVAEPSRPVPLRGGIGVLMVCDREGGPDALPSRDQIAEALARDRLDNLARRYLRDLRRAAYVDQRV
jgi:peptidyl-prolyl cis-trans isomerase SurA